ncbi:hypothetical protein PG993_010562 [Apiospora rasikravindrae]|uniref:C2H2-type domain-containing protein n=1 Tax=Apiospora rasikravindrae TaxID=990691 RepID=A0ABR1SMJ5_9PEZI
MAPTRVPCPKCSLTFRKQKHLRRHLKNDPHHVAKCPFPIKDCQKVYADYNVMVKHLRKDVQDHSGLGLDEIHKLVASMHADKEAIAKLEPEKWVLQLFRNAKRENKEMERTNEKRSDLAPSKKLKRKAAAAMEKKNEQVKKNKNNSSKHGGESGTRSSWKFDLTGRRDHHKLIADEPMKNDGKNKSCYESEPEEWWK